MYGWVHPSVTLNTFDEENLPDWSFQTCLKCESWSIIEFQRSELWKTRNNYNFLYKDSKMDFVQRLHFNHNLDCAMWHFRKEFLKILIDWTGKLDTSVDWRIVSAYWLKLIVCDVSVSLEVNVVKLLWSINVIKWINNMLGIKTCLECVRPVKIPHGKSHWPRLSV